MKYYLGIDAGSSYIKLVLIDSLGKAAGRSIIQRGSDINQSCCESYSDLLNTHKVDKSEIGGIVATGYGRKQVSFCDEVITEITALSIGGFSVDSKVRAIIDIGGQDSKVIAVNESGKTVDFIMNQKCSAGTGKFLEVTK
jgi:predicted CoA-substrate-specific enzyme activase